MKRKVKAILGIALCAAIMVSLNVGTEVYAQEVVPGNMGGQQDKVIIDDNSELQRISDADAKLVLNELNLKESELSQEEVIALLTTGTATVWNKTYSKETNVKKKLTMTANLMVASKKPYTKIQITNIGKSSITAIAYHNAVLGSHTLGSATIAKGASKTLTIPRSAIIRYGTINGQGIRSYLTYTVSVYNKNGAKVSFKAKAVRYD